jgi:hypothetical protein
MFCLPAATVVGGVKKTRAVESVTSQLCYFEINLDTLLL